MTKAKKDSKIYNWYIENDIPKISFYADKIHKRNGCKWIYPVHEVTKAMNREITIPWFWIPGKAGLEFGLAPLSFEKSFHQVPKKLLNALSAGKIDLFTTHCLIDSTTRAIPIANNKYNNHEKYNFLLNFVAINFSNLIFICKIWDKP